MAAGEEKAALARAVRHLSTPNHRNNTLCLSGTVEWEPTKLIINLYRSEVLINAASRYNSVVTRRAKSSQRKPVTRDTDIRQTLLANLSQIYCDKEHDLIVQEFGCNSARTDIAVINGALHAFEIKSDSDSLDRLPSQIEAYQGVFEYITLVCGRRLLDRARVTVPTWWGLQKAEYKNDCVVLRQLRAPKLNPHQDALALAKMLWKKEALACLRKHG